MTQENEVQNKEVRQEICPKCGSVVKENFNVCTKCGTVIKSNEAVLHKTDEDEQKVSSSLGIGVGVFTVVALVVLFQISAILGMLLYFIAFGIAVNVFKDDERVAKGEYIALVKECFQKENLLSKGILMVVILLIPIVICVGLHRWLFADTMREVEYMYDQFGGY